MTTDLFTVQEDDAVEMVANLMIWERIRHVPVEDKDHKLVGVLTHRAVLRFVMGGGSPRRTAVSEIMKRDVTTVSPETTTVEALRLMRRLRVGCLPVLQDDRLVGIVTEEDFMEIASKMLESQLASDEAISTAKTDAKAAAKVDAPGSTIEAKLEPKKLEAKPEAKPETKPEAKTDEPKPPRVPPPI